MWEAIKSVLTSANAWQVLVTAVIIVVAAVLCVRAGIISINTKHVTIGADERERDTIRRQKEYAHSACTSMLNTILKMDSNLDVWRVKCVLEYVYDEIIDWITFNHITTDSEYVAVKSASLRAIVRSNVDKDIFFTDEFNQVIDSFARNMITELIRIRKIQGGTNV